MISILGGNFHCRTSATRKSTCYRSCFAARFLSRSRLPSDRDRSQLSASLRSVPLPTPEFPIPSQDRAAKIPCLASARACRIARLAQGSSESSSPAFATTSPSSCARPSQKLLPRESRASSSFSCSRWNETITSRFPIFSGLGFCPRKNFRSQLRGNFSIVPPNRQRIFSSSEQFGTRQLPRSHSASRSRNNCEPLARNFMQCRFVGSEPDRAGSLSPNEHQPTTRKLFLLRSFGFLLLRHFLR